MIFRVVLKVEGIAEPFYDNFYAQLYFAKLILVLFSIEQQWRISYFTSGIWMDNNNSNEAGVFDDFIICCLLDLVDENNANFLN